MTTQSELELEIEQRIREYPQEREDGIIKKYITINLAHIFLSTKSTLNLLLRKQSNTFIGCKILCKHPNIQTFFSF